MSLRLRDSIMCAIDSTRLLRLKGDHYGYCRCGELFGDIINICDRRYFIEAADRICSTANSKRRDQSHAGTERQSILVPLAVAFRLNGNVMYLSELEKAISRDISKEGYKRMKESMSAFDVALRLINWTFCWHLISDDISEKIRIKWVEAIYQHCFYIHTNHSLYSSADYRLIGEAAGLFIATTALMDFKESLGWRKHAYNILERECQTQVFGDGVHKEQSTAYQHVVMDLLLLAGFVGLANRIDFSADYWKKIEKMMEYGSAIEDAGGNIPQFGDDGDICIMDLGQKEFGYYRSLLNTGAFLFGREDFLRNQWGLDAKTEFYLSIASVMDKAGCLKEKIWPQVNQSIPLRFDMGGYYILGNDFNTAREQKLIFDCGAIGYLSTAAHGHADALSFYFSAGGQPIFVDPGSYPCAVNRKMHNYFRGTSCHNTVCIDGRNQSEMLGDFIWGAKAHAKMLEYEEKTLVRGEHNGYGRLKDRLHHVREITYNRENDFWRIVDEMICHGEHFVEIFLHLHPDCILEKYEFNRIYITFPGGTCVLTHTTDMEIDVFYGDAEELSGWYSPKYGIKVPCSTLRLSKRITGSYIFEMSFALIFGGG